MQSIAATRYAGRRVRFAAAIRTHEVSDWAGLWLRIDTSSGPFSMSATLGPAELEMTLEPAKVGPNTIHLYLIDAKTGTHAR